MKTCQLAVVVVGFPDEAEVEPADLVAVAVVD